MDREAAEGLRMGSTLIFLAAVLSIGLVIFWFARSSGNKFFDSFAEQNDRIKTEELERLVDSGNTDMPVASLYTVLSREWRAVDEVRILSKSGSHIVTAKAEGNKWVLFDLDGNPATLTLESAGTVAVYTSLSGPERALYALDGGVYSSTLKGRCIVSVSVDKSTLTYDVVVRLKQ